jgi:PadR family transcriptional regulator, regulatory protein PadR
MATKSEPADEGKGGFRPRLQGHLLSSTLLAYLRNWNAYGYQLVQELAKAGLPAFDSATVYRTLRQLERAGLVSSFWDTSSSGPARRMYTLTKAGEGVLSLWVDVLSHYQSVLQRALRSYEKRDPKVAPPAQPDAESSPDEAGTTS